MIDVSSVSPLLSSPEFISSCSVNWNRIIVWFLNPIARGCERCLETQHCYLAMPIVGAPYLSTLARLPTDPCFIPWQQKRQRPGPDKKGNIGSDAIYSGALSNDLLFIQNWVNSNTSAETSKHDRVQWFHKQLFNSPLPAFPDKQPPNLLFCAEGSHCFMASDSQGWEPGWLTLKLLVPLEAFQVSCTDPRTMSWDWFLCRPWKARGILIEITFCFGSLPCLQFVLWRTGLNRRGDFLKIQILTTTPYHNKHKK